MPGYPSIFYYNTQNSTPKYSQSPPGELIVTRMINGQKPWKQHGSRVLKEKTLILADWTAENWSYEKINAVRQRISKLMDQGFILYLWQDNHLLPFDKNDLAKLDDKQVRQAIKPASFEDIYNTAVTQYALKKNQLQILDTYYLQVAIDQEPTVKPRLVKVSDFVHSSHKLDDIFRMIPSNTMPIETIIQDEFSNATSFLLTTLRQKLPATSIDKDYKILTVSADIIPLLIRNSSINLNNENFYLNDLQQIESFTIRNANTFLQWDDLSTILLAMPKLRQLKLTSIDLVGDLENNLVLKELESISLIMVKIDEKFLEQLLINTSKVKHLELTDLHITEEMLLTLNKLESLSLSSVKISEQSLETLLGNNRMLKQLTLDACTITDEMVSSLVSLESLSLSRVKINAKTLEKILKQNPNINKIKLQQCEIVGEIEDDLASNALTSFSINSITNLSTNSLQKILVNAKVLKTMCFDEYFEFDKEEIKEALALNTVESLSFNYTPIDAKSMENLLIHASSLKSLQLTFCFLEEDIERQLPLTALESLSFDTVKLTAKSMQNLLIKATSLKTLSFNFNARLMSGCPDEMEFEEYQIYLKELQSLKLDEEVTLSAIETVRITNALITIKSLQNLLAKATSLKTLQIAHCKIDDELETNLSLPTLEDLDLTEVKISAKTLGHLLSGTVSLKKLSIQKLTGDLTVLQDRLPNLESLTLNDYTLTTEDLIHLLKIMPKLSQLTINNYQEINLGSSELKNLLKGKNFYIKEGYKKLSPTTQDLGKDKEKALTAPETKMSDPIHDAKTFLDKTRTEPDKPAVLQNNSSKNQTMVIYKLSEYLKIVNKDLDLLPKIPDGICEALAQLFYESSLADWVVILDGFANWDGQKETLTEPLIESFEILLLHIKKKYVYGVIEENSYIELDSLTAFLGSEEKATFILQNAWHAIGVKKSEKNNQWQVYDPNYVAGHKTVSTEALQETIEASLGKVIELKGTFPNLLPLITDVNNFIQEGGLLTLTNPGTQQIDELLSQVENKTVSQEGLEQGLLIRNNNGVPAWKLGLASRHEGVKHYTTTLLTQFQKHNAKASEILAKSIQHLPAFEQYSCAESLTTVQPSSGKEKDKPSALEAISHAIHRQKATDTDYFASQFATWRTVKPSYESKKHFCQRLLNGEKTKLLIKLSSSAAVNAMGIALEQHCQNIHRPVFYIDSPDDMVCSASYIEKQGNKGILKKGPGGPLHEFLIQQVDESNPPVLIVNYDNFEAEDIVRLNSLLDKERRIDGTPLAPSAIVVGLINPDKPNCYKGEDFYSRFGINGIETSPLTNQQLQAEKPPLLVKKEAETKTFPVNLYHAQDWKERLLGHWKIKKDSLFFEEGLLVSALQSGLPIEIQNGSWDNAAFSHFWDRAVELGYLEIQGQKLDISQLTFTKSEGYNWQELMQKGEWDYAFKEDAIVLNSSLLNTFFTQYHCDNNSHTLETLPGIIEANRGATLDINLTRNLSQDDWALLLSECEKNQVKLQCHCAQNVILPEIFNVKTTKTSFKEGQASVICSTDIDTTVAELVEGSQWQVVDISECTGQDLLTRLDGSFDNNTLRFDFTQSISVLNQALAEKRKILLKGSFSAELADALAPLLLENQKQTEPRFLLVSNDTSLFEYIPVEHRQVNSQEKLAILQKKFGELDTKSPALQNIENESISQIEARLRMATDPWQGLTGLSAGIKLKDFDPVKSKEIVNAFIKKRQVEIETILNQAPFVCLTGLTAVGKSTFVEKHLVKEGEQLYQGVPALLEWAKDFSTTRKYLFLDEANISSKEWSEFEGLFNNPPSILINGKLHELDDNHKVIFAVNPLSYGDRYLASLFANHGNALIFDPLPQEFIYEQILKPIFAKTPLEEHALAISDEILRLYRFLCEYSKDEVLISPRELQMIAILVLSRLQTNPEADILPIVRHYIRLISQDLVPKEAMDQFNKTFKALTPQPSFEKKLDNFIVTPTRAPLYQQLSDLTTLREYRRNVPELNELQRYGGLGGIVIEGEPGIGKSELVIAQLLEAGYTEATISTEVRANNVFYRLPISLQTDEKEALLLKAFDEGAVVLIDEINSSPMMETLLNDLLMGKKPGGGRPLNPGFMVIGTQNPTTMEGRYEASTALRRRLTTTVLPPYPALELEKILTQKGVLADTAKVMVAAYLTQLSHAKQNHLNPLPSVRDLIIVAENWVKNYPAAEEKPTPKITDLVDSVIEDTEAPAVSVQIKLSYLDSAIGYIYNFLTNLASIESSDLLDYLAIYQVIQTFTDKETLDEAIMDAKLTEEDVLALLEAEEFTSPHARLGSLYVLNYFIRAHEITSKNNPRFYSECERILAKLSGLKPDPETIAQLKAEVKTLGKEENLSNDCKKVLSQMRHNTDYPIGWPELLFVECAKLAKEDSSLAQVLLSSLTDPKTAASAKFFTPTISTSTRSFFGNYEAMPATFQITKPVDLSTGSTLSKPSTGP